MLIESAIAPRGSALYYSLRCVHGDKRTAILAVVAIAKALSDTAEKAVNPEAAAAKLNWWQQEINALFAGTPTHPHTKALLPHLIQFQLKPEPLLALVEANELTLNTQVFATQSDLARHYQHIGGIREGIKAQILNEGKHDNQVQKFAHYLGITLEAVRHINYFATFYQRQQLYLPESDLQSLSTQAALDPKNQTALIPLLKAQASEAKDTWRLAKEHLPKAHYKTQRPGLILGKIAIVTLANIEQDGFQVFKHAIQLSPLNMLWRSVF